MARRSIPIDEKIAKQQEVVDRIKARYETETAKLNALLKKKDQEKEQEILEAIESSDKSLDEIMNYIKG
ncbi:MAG: ErpK protein [Eubacteriales bacterium]|jgi:hypothetical protein